MRAAAPGVVPRRPVLCRGARCCAAAPVFLADPVAPKPLLGTTALLASSARQMSAL